MKYVILSLYHTRMSENFLTWYRKGGGYTLDLCYADVMSKEDAEKNCSNRGGRNVAIELEKALAHTCQAVRVEDMGKLGVTREMFLIGQKDG